MKQRFLSLFLIFFLIVGCIPPIRTDAATTYCLNETRLKAYIGNHFNLFLKDKTSESDDYYDNIRECDWHTSNSSVATVTMWGSVDIVGTGKATITATYEGKKYNCYIFAYNSPYRPSKTSITAKTFEEVAFHLTHNSKVSYYNYNVYRKEDNEWTDSDYDDLSIDIDDETGNLVMTGNRPGSYKIDFITRAGDKDLQSYQSSTYATITVHGLIESDIRCAMGTTKALTFGDLNNVTFETYDSSVATVSPSGIVTPMAVGTTTVIMTGETKTGTLEYYTCDITITDPKVTLDCPYVRVNDTVSFTCSEDSWVSDISYHSHNPKIIQADSHELYAITEGHTIVAITVDGKKFTFPIDVIDLRLNIDDNSILIQKGSKTKVEVLGLAKAMKQSKISYSVGNPNVASVSSNGTITAKGYGSTLLTVKLDDITLTASISVGSKQALEAIHNAQEAIDSKYSLDKRMQKGYYDCSSLIWRSYSPAGVKFGSNSYAPTAANLAKYLADHHKLLPAKDWNVRSLRPGDLIFTMGPGNGRYKNIEHVALFSGIKPGYFYDYYGSNDAYTGTIIHAIHQGVSKSEINSVIDSSRYLVGRP